MYLILIDAVMMNNCNDVLILMTGQVLGKVAIFETLYKS